MVTTDTGMATAMDARSRQGPDEQMTLPPRTTIARDWLAAGLLLFWADHCAAQIMPLNSMQGLAGIGVQGLPDASVGRSSTFLPGVRTTLTASDSLATAAGNGSSGMALEVTPYVNASIASARTQGSIGYQMRNFFVRSGDGSDAFMRHDLRASLNSLLISDWFGVQTGAAIYNTNASISGGLSADPGASRNNNAVLRTVSVAPYIQGRFGSFATYFSQYRFDHSDSSGNIAPSLARASHTLSLNVMGGPQFNPWGWAFNASGSRREFSNGLTLGSTSSAATLYYTPSSELRLGASLNYLAIDRLTNREGQTSGWGPGLSVDWSPSRRTTLRASVARQYYGTTAYVSAAYRTNRFVFGLDYNRSVFQSNNAALLTFNPGAVLSGGGFSPDLNPLFSQLTGLGLLSNSSTVIGTTIINDALVRNRSVTASVGYIMPRWSATATVFRTARETMLSSEVFGVSNALAPASFGLFNTSGITLASNITLDARNSVLLSASSFDTTASNNNASTRFSVVQATYASRIDTWTSASLAIRRSMQSGNGGFGRDENAIIGTYDHRFR